MSENNKKLSIDETLVRHLVATQFPQWRDLPVQTVKVGGWDNRTFHLGEHMLVRMPSAERYAMKVEKEQKWLPKLAPLLPLPIPTPLAMGEPNDSYPWYWSVYGWIEGETAAIAPIVNICDFAASLAHFLSALQHIDPTGGPLPGPHNFYRGGSLMTYDAETRQAITALKGKIDGDAAAEVWETALATSWQSSPVWIHGDVSVGNLLVQEGRLYAVIDFGGLGVGDPACDLVIAWTFFRDQARKTFRALLPLDEGTWARGRAWALWKALIVAAGLTETNPIEAAHSLRTIEEVLADHKQSFLLKE